ncbi:MAG: polysaccharide deacetylase family protein [Candidatus Omnitrophica bacterium]|nr:polysaccharide deacetylase family protein [Candidatus Omnitrophota bacterium]
MPFFLRYEYPILNYHRVGVQEGDPTMRVSQESFDRQMSLLASQGRAISLEGLISLLASKPPSLPKKVAVTFDDGYEDNYTHAFSILKTYRIPVTIFLVTGWIGKKEFLSWEAIQEMSKEGISFGSHTKNHPYLPSVESRQVLEEEIKGSKELLENRLGKEVPLFSYPFGGFTEEAKQMVQEAGYQAAVTSNRGEKGRERDLFALSRIKMTDASTPSLIFHIKTSGYYEQFKKKKKAC